MEPERRGGAREGAMGREGEGGKVRENGEGVGTGWEGSSGAEHPLN